MNYIWTHNYIKGIGILGKLWSWKLSAHTWLNCSIIYRNHFIPVLNIQDKQLCFVAIRHTTWLRSSCWILIQNISPVDTQQPQVFSIHGPILWTLSATVVKLHGLRRCYPRPVVVSLEVDSQITPAALKCTPGRIISGVLCGDSCTFHVTVFFIVDSQHKLGTLIIHGELNTRLKLGPIWSIRMAYDHLQFHISREAIPSLHPFRDGSRNIKYGVAMIYFKILVCYEDEEILTKVVLWSLDQANLNAIFCYSLGHPTINDLKLWQFEQTQFSLKVINHIRNWGHINQVYAEFQTITFIKDYSWSARTYR